MSKGLAILGVPVMGGGPKTLVVTTFTQSLGAELLTNGDFSAWTGDNPDGWTVGGETAPDPEVTERDPGQGHADVKTVGGSVNFYASAATFYPTVKQDNILIVGGWYEGHIIYSKPSAAPRFYIGGVYASLHTHRLIVRANNANVVYQHNSAAHDTTVDSMSVKRITLNAQQVMSANAIVDFTYTLPASPAASDTISIFYRISDASLEAGYNCWRAYLQRNTANTAWDFRLDSVNAGTVTNRINVTGVGDTVGIRVQCVGSLHDCWTTANGTDWTKRGGQINVSWNDTATGINTIYCTGTTPTKLTATPV